jgi:hypothetical protein
VVGLACVAIPVLRTIVTPREVVVHAGLRREIRIPLAGVTGVALTRFDAQARRRVAADGRGAFVAIHPTKQIVRIEWTGAAGEDHVAYVASEAPEALADVIGRASATARTALQVRVADSGATAGGEARTGEPASANEQDGRPDRVPR